MHRRGGRFARRLFTYERSAEPEGLKEELSEHCDDHIEVRELAAHYAGHHRMMGVSATASAEDIADGARLVLVPDDSEQLVELQRQARRHVARMSRGECRMMETHAHQHGAH